MDAGLAMLAIRPMMGTCDRNMLASSVPKLPTRAALTRFTSQLSGIKLSIHIVFSLLYTYLCCFNVVD